MRVVQIAPAVLPYQTPIYNAIADRVDLHVIYLSEPTGRRASQLWTGYDDPWGTAPRFQYCYAPARSITVGALDLLTSLPRRFGPVLDAFNPDVVSVWGWTPTSVPAILWTRKHHIPTLMWSESSRTSGLLHDPVSNAYRRRLVRRSDAYLTVGQAARDFAIQLGASPGRCVEAWLPSALPVCDPEPMPGEDAAGKLRILWVGRLVKLKRPEVAIEAFGRIAREVVGASLTMVGSGPLEARVRAAAARVGGSIELVGRVEGERLGSIYRSHDVLLVTSVREVWGLVVNEALAHDLFVIASDEVGAARSLLEENTGRVVPADDVEAFVDALRGFAAARHSRPPGASAGGRIRECTPEAFADRYVQAVDLAVSRRAALEPATGQ